MSDDLRERIKGIMKLYGLAELDFTYEQPSRPIKMSDELLALILDEHKRYAIEELQALLNTASGGGSWRRVAETRIAALRGDNQPN